MYATAEPENATGSARRCTLRIAVAKSILAKLGQADPQLWAAPDQLDEAGRRARRSGDSGSTRTSERGALFDAFRRNEVLRS